MFKMVVELEWSDELGERWMNIDNLHLLLYGQMYTNRSLLSSRDITEEVETNKQRAEILQTIMVTKES